MAKYWYKYSFVLTMNHENLIQYFTLKLIFRIINALFDIVFLQQNLSSYSLNSAFEKKKAFFVFIHTCTCTLKKTNKNGACMHRSID